MNRGTIRKFAWMADGAVSLLSFPVAVMAQSAATISQAPMQSPPQPLPNPIYGYGMMGGWGPGYGYGYGMGPGMMGYGGYGMFFGGLLWILILIGIIAAIMFLVRSLFSGRSVNAGDDGKTALKALGERYARGEIGREEYLEKKRDLSG